MAKKKHVYTEPPDAEKRKRLAELELQIVSFKTNGRLWDVEDEQVNNVLKERDDLFYEINTHLSGLSFHDMDDAQYEEIDKAHQEQCEKETPYDDD